MRLRVKELAAMLPPQAQGVGRPIVDRAAWEAISQLPGLKDCVSAAEKSLEQPLPELTEELYLEFSRTGNRTALSERDFRPSRTAADLGGRRVCREPRAIPGRHRRHGQVALLGTQLVAAGP